MTFRGYILAVFLISISLSTMGCATQEIRSRSISYNEAVSLSGDELLLLNAVRASKRYPLYFSTIGDLTGNESIQGSLTSSLPFSIGPPGNHIQLPNVTLAPNLTRVSSGISQFAVGPLNSGEFLKAIHTEVDAALFRDFLSNDWPKELIFSVMIQNIRVRPHISDSTPTL